MKPGTLWIGGWVGSRASLGAVTEKKFLQCPCRESNLYTDSATLAPGKSERTRKDAPRQC